MAPMINPFDAGGYTLAEMTQAINILPNVYTRLGELRLFRFEGITQRSVIIEQAEGVLARADEQHRDDVQGGVEPQDTGRNGHRDSEPLERDGAQGSGGAQLRESA